LVGISPFAAKLVDVSVKAIDTPPVATTVAPASASPSDRMRYVLLLLLTERRVDVQGLMELFLAGSLLGLGDIRQSRTFRPCTVVRHRPRSSGPLRPANR